MTKAQALEVFRADIMPIVRERFERDGRADYPARSEAWNEYTDSLCKDGSITLRQYETWTAPPECGR
jgi:hypothetical protein